MGEGERNEFDVVVVGAGAAGMTAAIRAHDLGLSVVVVEAGEKLGGATAFSGGQVWVGANHTMARRGMADSLDETRAYVRAIADPPDMIDDAVFEQWVEQAPRVVAALEEAGAVEWTIVDGLPDYYHPGAEGAKEQGRYLACAAIEGGSLGEQRQVLLTSPHHPPGPTYGELFETWGDEKGLRELAAARAEADILTFGTGLAAHLLRALAEREVPILLEHRAIELMISDGAVTGVVCETGAGRVELGGAVILTTGTYDWNVDLVERHSGVEEENAGSVAPLTIRGDGIDLARQAGAEIFQMPIATSLQVPGYRGSEGQGDDGGFRFVLQLSYPHSIMVGGDGRRFCDDSFYRTVIKALLGDGGRGRLPYFLIWDENHHERYGFAPAGPGEPYPAEMGVASAETLPELATALGIDPDGLAATVERFNDGARKGIDPEFHRGENSWATTFLGDPQQQPCPVLGPIERPPFFGMRMSILGTAVGAAGVRAGVDGRALDPEGAPIAGLYAAGSAAAPTATGTGYNSGFAISCAMTFGHLAAEHIGSELAARSGSPTDRGNP